MRKIILYSAVSLNGKIASADGGVEWLEEIPNPDKTDYGYFDFYKNIDTTIQGFTTYQQIINWGIDFPYADKKNYVLTSQSDLPDTEHVEFISEKPIEFIKELKAKEGADIWLIGGGIANSSLLNAGLIDEMIVHIMPILIPNGTELFGGIPIKSLFTLIKSKTYSSGVVELKYSFSPIFD